MTFYGALVRSAVGGAGVSLLLATIWWAINHGSHRSPSLEGVLERITLMVWPSSFVLISADASMSASFVLEGLAVAIALNALLYLVLGALLWYGFRKRRLFLPIPIGLIGGFWLWTIFLLR